MSWSEFLASEFAQTVAFIGSILSILVFVGMVCRFVYLYVRKSILPWEAWVLFLMLIGTTVAIRIYSEPLWFSRILFWVIIIMLELHARMYKGLLKQATENAERAIGRAEEAIGLTENAHNLTRKALSLHQEKPVEGENHG